MARAKTSMGLRPKQDPADALCVVEVLAAYSHSAQLADLRFCINTALFVIVPAATPAPGRPWACETELDDRALAYLMDAYRAGDTAASIASAHGLSVRSVKRLLAASGVRRKQLPA
jgi:hypothetical protein